MHISSIIDEYLHVHILVVVNNAAMNIDVQLSLLNTALNFSGIYSGMELLDHVVIIFYFYFLRNCHVVFHSGCTILSSHQQHYMYSNFSMYWSTLIFCFLFVCLFVFTVAILMGVKWYLIAVLIYIFLTLVK